MKKTSPRHTYPSSQSHPHSRHPLINRFRRLIPTVSYLRSIIWGGLKAILSIPFHSVMMFISAFYNLGIGIARRSAHHRQEREEFTFVGVLTVLSSLAYIIYSIYGFYHGMRTNYHLYISIGIAVVAFIDIILAVVGVFRTRHSADLKSKIIKLLDLATSLIALSLTQTALASVFLPGDNSRFNGLFGISMGSLALIIGIYIIFLAKFPHRLHRH